MNIEPLSKKLYKKAVELGVETITLNFSGGNDESHLNIEISPSISDGGEFEKEIDAWVWETYEYSGAGDGNDYGDDITYDLKNKKATSTEWYMARTEGQGEEIDL